MRRRLYFLLPDIGRAQQILNELLLARIEERHIHILARDGTPMDDLPSANLLQRSDFLHGAEMGLALGGATGIVAGVLMMLFPPNGMEIGGGTVLALALAGAGIGAWAAGMIGTDVPNSQLRKFMPAIERGQVLLMVDVRPSEMQRVGDMIHNLHPEASDHGIEPTLPAFP
ncbi:MAG: DUF1269 domain-containing protein [Gammaproteobacteria bacterium]|nr:DUF1269 domain-containing protein [Gammaproteobacteria bacterium]